MKMRYDVMTENTDAEELEFQLKLGKIINKQPKLFQKWSELKDKFSVLGLYDSPFKETFFGVEDALAMINKEFGNDEPVLV
jgi:hypothetical protein